MTRFFLFIQIIVGLFYHCSIISARTTSIKVKPSKTDHSIKAFDSPHLVLYDRSSKQGKLLLFLPGSNGVAENGPDEFFATAIGQGYRVISLSYIDTPSVSTTCIGKVLAHDSHCSEKFRTKRVYGTNTTSLISDEPQDAIINRFVKLLLYLATNDKKGNWAMYLENDMPNWEQIALSGQSQGGGMAAYIAKRVSVARVIDFSGGTDRSSKNTLADWYFQKSATPLERWYATYNVYEPLAKITADTYEAMAIPSDHIYPLSLKVRSGKKAHGEGIKNPAYKPQWLEMLGVGN